MLNKRMEEALNSQIQAEFFSAYLYLSISAYFETLNLVGFAHWTRMQYVEEQGHALKFFDYVHERGGHAALLEIVQPQHKWDSPLAAFKEILSHEQMITERINQLVNIAIEESDHATVAMLQWFVTEQVEEEARADQNVQEMTLIKDSPSGLFMLNRELMQRTAEPSTDSNQK